MGSVPGSDDLYPIVELADLHTIHGLHEAAAAIKRLSNLPTKQELIDARDRGTLIDAQAIADALDLSPGQKQQRKVLLDIQLSMILSQRNKLLNKLSQAWLHFAS